MQFYLSEVGDKLLSINESDKSYPNLSRDERKTLHYLMNDDQGHIQNPFKLLRWSVFAKSVNEMKPLTVFR